jgi:hypothetical protein
MTIRNLDFLHTAEQEIPKEYKQMFRNAFIGACSANIHWEDWKRAVDSSFDYIRQEMEGNENNNRS